ncbi:MAG: arylsulfatase [Verrucomicrobiota bacterium]
MKFILLAFTVVAAITGHASAQPNVIVIITDDQGYGDLSCHGNPVIRTTHLDRMHSESVRFTDFHVAPMCTPTRGQLLTGLDAARNGAINVSSGRTLLRADLPTLADKFGKAGYATGIFGKWHLGDNFPFRPEDRGFRETLWFPSSHINSVPDVWENDYFGDTYRRNGGLVKYEGYCTDVFFDEAITWMESQNKSDKPFFAYIPTNAPHTPLWEPENYRTAMEQRFAAAEAEGFEFKGPKARRQSVIEFLAMIKNIDDNVGKLDAFLRESGLFENTIVVFLTDNGSTFGESYFNAGMRGRKTQLWEGGHRVPLFLRWPAGNLGAPRDVGGLSQAQDLMPTLLTLCDVGDVPPANGIDLAPYLRNNQTFPDDRMLVINYSRMPGALDYPTPDSPSIMRREGAGVLWKHWRLLKDRELYNLKTDPQQTNNVIHAHPDVTTKMRAHLDAWWSEVKDIANEPQPVIIGDDRENPMLLTACEWLDVFIDQQKQIRRADRKNGWWELDVAEKGTYSFELRRWPRDADLPLTAGIPPTQVADGELLPGVALPIASARLQIGQKTFPPVRIGPNDKSAQFTVELEPGRTRLHTWFFDESRQPLLGAYYVYVERKSS